MCGVGHKMCSTRVQNLRQTFRSRCGIWQRRRADVRVAADHRRAGALFEALAHECLPRLGNNASDSACTTRAGGRRAASGPTRRRTHSGRSVAQQPSRACWAEPIANPVSPSLRPPSALRSRDAGIPHRSPIAGAAPGLPRPSFRRSSRCTDPGTAIRPETPLRGQGC